MEEEILTDNSKVKGLIYLIENITDGTRYIGQTLSHRKNKGKYRPFGIEGRFKDHISEALCNTKKKQCRYLNNAIRKYGKESFKVTFVKECSKEELDTYEQYYIKEYNSYYPNGYNLTHGGKTLKIIDTENDVEQVTPQMPKKRGGCNERTEETRQKMSSSIKQVFNDESMRKKIMNNTQKQHEQQKFDRFKHLEIDISNIDKYIYERSSNNNKFIRVKVNGVQTDFVGKHQTLEELRTKAKDFLLQIHEANATLPNCGKPLKPTIPSCDGNITMASEKD